MVNKGFWRWYDRGSRVDFGGTLLGLVFDWKAWLFTASGGVLSMFTAAYDGWSVTACLFAAVGGLGAFALAASGLSILWREIGRRRDGGSKSIAPPNPGSPALKIEPGSGPLFESLEALSSGQVRKTSKIAVTNASGEHLSNCRVQIKYITPHPGWHLPQKLHLDTFSLIAGESKYIELASFFGGDKIRVKLPPSGTMDYDPDLPVGRYVVTLEATADQIKPVEAFIGVSVDGAAQLQVQDALIATTVISEEPWPNFKIWDKREKFELYEAACLWFNIEPRLPMPEKANSKYQTWKEMVFGGGLPIDVKNTLQIVQIGEERESAVTPHDLIDRGVLETLAETESYQPLFLYPHKRGGK